MSENIASVSSSRFHFKLIMLSDFEMESDAGLGIIGYERTPLQVSATAFIFCLQFYLKFGYLFSD